MVDILHKLDYQRKRITSAIDISYDKENFLESSQGHKWPMARPDPLSRIFSFQFEWFDRCVAWATALGLASNPGTWDVCPVDSF